MRKTAPLLALTLTVLLATPVAAYADVTAFLGATLTPSSRSARGVAVGISLLVVGFEFEYASTAEDPLEDGPSLKTGMLNGLVQTPTRTQLYLTAGGGFFRERLNDEGETSFGTNVGGGIKMGLAGPLRLRVDYRIFNLRGNARYKNPQRFYVGANFSF
jgi:hypothetical protein